MNRPKNEKGQFIHVEWEQWQLGKLIELYPNMLTEEIAIIIHRGIYSVRNKAHQLGLKKSKEFRSMTGKMSSENPKCIASRFKKGNIPVNKGKTWDEYIPIDSQVKCREKCYKKGNIPTNHKPVGHERITKDGYIEIKIQEPNLFELKHRIVWRQYHGEIPAGCNIQFKDGNKQNLDINNLYMISRNKQIDQNTIHRYPGEIKLAIKRVSKIKKLINK